VLYVDPSGNVVNLVGGLIATGVGALVGAGLNIGGQLIANGGDFGNLNAMEALAAGAAGAVTAGLMVATCGASLAIEGAIAVGGSSAAGYLTYNLVSGEETTLEGVATVTVVGGLTAGMASKFGARIGPIKSAGKITVPKARSLSDVEARRWYLDSEAKIAGMIDKTKPLEQQARQAVNLRNQFRTQAREAMSNQQAAEELFSAKPNKTWEQLVREYESRGFSGNALYEEIIRASQRSNVEVNRNLGVFPK
jgi:filamentous hemagglutinin